MLRLALAAIARPRAALAAWIVIGGVLAAIGLGVESRLSPSVTVIPGTASSHAATLAEKEFGPSALVPILLEGSAGQLDVQGPKLVADLSARPDTRVMSAWSTGVAGASLRPRPDAAVIVASVARSEDEMVKTYQERIENVVDRSVSGPVRATVTGQPAIDRALRDEALDDALRAELIGIAIMSVALVVLLGSFLAAAAVAAVGAVTALASFGVMAILGTVFPVDPVAVTLASLAGVALGTGFALMMVRRFREAETPRRSRAAAARAAGAAVLSSGRATLVGGTALIVALTLAMLLSSIEFQFSIGIGVVTCAAFGVGAAVAVLPAFLVLAGHRLDSWRPAPPAVLARPWGRLVALGDTIVRRRMLSGALATAALLALALPLLGLSTGPPNITMLPSDSPARQSFERVSAVMGPGWPTPYNLLIVADRPLTTSPMLREIEDLQARLAGDVRVDSVLGPGAFREQRQELNKLPEGLDESARVAESSKKDLAKLQDGLGLAGDGAAKLRGGLSAAADGAGKLQAGSGAAGGGSGRLAAGLASARDGARQISAGLNAALAGARTLRDGAAKALAGSQQLSGGLDRADTPLTAGLPALKGLAANAATVDAAVASGQARATSASQAVSDALARLRALPSQDDPAFQAALSALAGAKTTADQLAASLGAAAKPAAEARQLAGMFANQTAELAAGVKRLLAGSVDLAAGIGRLREGNADLAGGLQRLNAGGGDLTKGLAALEAGARQLQGGLGQLEGGAGQLAAGLGSGVGPAGELASGLGTMETKVAKARGSVPSTEDLEKLKAQSPGLFDSGYFVLAAVAGAPSEDRDTASFAINVEGGGNAGQIVVVARSAADSEETMALGATLREEARRFAAANHVDWAIGGPAGSMADFNDYGRSHVVLALAAIAAAIAVLLMVALQAVGVALVAVLVDLLAVAATFGALTLVFEGDDPLLGGPGYLDPMSIIGIFAVVFGVTTVYETLLLYRTRERFVETGDPRAAVAAGLRESAWAATGAAVAMVAVALPFMAADLLSVRQFGAGLAVAVLLDSLVVRPVLLPAALAALGERAWWPTRGPSPSPPREPDPGIRSGRFARAARAPAEVGD